MNKSEIRNKIYRIRKIYNAKNLEIHFEDILKILKKNKHINKIVGGYYPYNYEVDAVKILEKLEKLGYKITLPKIREHSQMDFFSWSSKDPLSINKYGIPEPTSEKIMNPSILLVPLLAFDKNNNRIGYGGGFYDRYIKKNKKIISIGLAYSVQKVNKIITNEHDMKLNFVVTNKKKK